MHLTTARQAGNLPLFIEKPLSHNLDQVEQLPPRVLVGYNLRYDQSLRRFKQSLEGKKITAAKIVCQSWLPDWRPGRDYRETYSAKKALGGGVLLDLSHEIDYALWFFGSVKAVKAKLKMAPELKIETEAVADLQLTFDSGVIADIHLSYASQKFARYCEVKTADGQTLRWDYTPNNDMYLEEMNHFARVVAGKEDPLVTVADGINVLKVIELAKNQ